MVKRSDQQHNSTNLEVTSLGRTNMVLEQALEMGHDKKVTFRDPHLDIDVHTCISFDIWHLYPLAFSHSHI